MAVAGQRCRCYPQAKAEVIVGALMVDWRFEKEGVQLVRCLQVSSHQKSTKAFNQACVSVSLSFPCFSDATHQEVS